MKVSQLNFVDYSIAEGDKKRVDGPDACYDSDVYISSVSNCHRDKHDILNNKVQSRKDSKA